MSPVEENNRVLKCGTKPKVLICALPKDLLRCLAVDETKQLRLSPPGAWTLNLNTVAFE